MNARLQKRRQGCSQRFFNSIFLCLLANRALATDWPQYRGPNHDGVSTETIRMNWAEAPPRVVWKVPLDAGLSSLAIQGSKVFTQARRGNSELCLALDANTGQQLWASPPLDDAAYPHGGVGSDDGPRSTPAVDGDRVFVFTSYLRLFCLNAANGQVVWSKDFRSEYGSGIIAWQNAASPLVVGDLVFVNCNAPTQSLLALRKADGSVAWRGQNDGMTHATPIWASLGGQPQVIFFTQAGLVSVVPESGTVLWRQSVRYNSTSVAASPLVGGDLVYGSRAYAPNSGAVVVRVSNSGVNFTAQPVWSNSQPRTMNHWCSPVYFNGHVYGMFGQGSLTFKCIEMATGTEKWSRNGFGYGSVLVVHNKILALSDDGELALVEPNPQAYTELTRFTALTGGSVKCWNVPALSNGRIYVRSSLEAVCLDVSAAPLPPPPPLKLQSFLASDSRGFRLTIGSNDGAPLTAARLEKIDIFGASNLTGDPPAWLKLSTPVLLTNGQLQLEDPDSATQSQRFFRVEERP